MILFTEKIQDTGQLKEKRMNLVDKFICEIDKGLKFSMDNYQKQSRDILQKIYPKIISMKRKEVIPQA